MNDNGGVDRLAEFEERSFGSPEDTVTSQGESGEFKFGWPVV